MARMGVAALSAFLALTLLAGQASASTITVQTTLGCWAQLEPCTSGGPVALGDKTFVGRGGNLGNFLPVVFTWDDGGTASTYADDVYSMTLSGLSSVTSSTSLSYFVYIVDPNYSFKDVALSSTAIAPGYSVTKYVGGGFNFNFLLATLTSSDGSTAGPAALYGQAILVQDDININGGRLSDLTNTFTQQAAVPEPASLLLVGLGIAALARRLMRGRQP